MMSLPETSIVCLVRVIQVLIDNDTITVTNLAMLSRMNHKRCNRLVAHLEHTGIVRVMTDEKRRRRHVTLTEKGSLFATKLVEANKLQSPLP